MQHLYTINRDGLVYTDQTNDREIQFDWKLMSLFGMASAKRSSFASVTGGTIDFSEYITDQTRSFVNLCAMDRGNVLLDEGDRLSFSCEGIRSFLSSQGIGYVQKELVPPLFLNEMTCRKCIFAYAKGLVLESMDGVTESFWERESKLKIDFGSKSLADAATDLFVYAGLLPSDYVVGQDYTNAGYYVVFEDSEDLPLANVCEWLLDQDLGFEADVPPIDEPRGNTREAPPAPEPELPEISGYDFDEWEIPSGGTIVYDGAEHQFPEIVAGDSPTLPETSVEIRYRLSTDSEWHLEPPSVERFGGYVCVARVAPKAAFASQFRTKYLSFGANIVKRMAVVTGVSRSVEYDGEQKTLVEMQVDGISGVTESGLASGDSIVVKGFSASYVNVGGYQIVPLVIGTGYDIVDEENGEIRNDCYLSSERAGTLTISESSVAPSVPQEKVFIFSSVEAEPFPIPQGKEAYFVAPFRPFISRRTGGYNSLTFEAVDTDSVAEISVYFLQEGEVEPSSDDCYFSGQVHVTDGRNRLDFGRQFAQSSYSSPNLCVMIRNMSGTQINIRSGMYGDGSVDGGALVGEAETVDFDELRPVGFTLAMFLERDELASNSFARTWVDGQRHLSSSIYPFGGGLYDVQANIRQSSVCSWYVSREEIPFWGRFLKSVRVKVPSFVTAEDAPEGISTVASLGAKVVDSPFDGNTLPDADFFWHYGKVVTGAEDGWIEFVSGVPAAEEFPPEGGGWILRLECASGYVDVENTLCSGEWMSAGNMGTTGFSVSTNAVSSPRMGFRPVTEFVWGDGESEVIVKESKRIAVCWVPDISDMTSTAVQSVNDGRFTISGTIVDKDGAKWIRSSDGSLSISFATSGADATTLDSVRRISLGGCFFSPDGGAGNVMEFSVCGETVSVPIGTDSANDVYKSVTIGAERGEGSVQFSVSMNAEDGEIYCRNLVIVIDYLGSASA